MSTIETQLSALFEEWAGEKTTLILPIAPSGSDRVYYRIKGTSKTAIGTFNPDEKENHAFLVFSKHFKAKGINVPQIYAEGKNSKIYLQEDIGDTALYDLLMKAKGDFSDELLDLYKTVVEQLAFLQINGGEGLDYAVCYPRAFFDEQSMLWDLQSFKYYFVKQVKITFDEQALEKDFNTFVNYLQAADCSHFMFRDFQSRNIMIKDGAPYFIDYQGGRKGALQYDLASLLFQAKANIPHSIRQDLLDYYLDAVAALKDIDRKQFTDFYYGYVLIRCLQVMGTYGFRGLIERKAHFLSSIPFAINNIKWLLANIDLPVDLPELSKVLHAITELKQFEPKTSEHKKLTVKISSFSYKKSGIPSDASGNGGGFVFDCRFIHNPGRYEPYKRQTGRDEPVMTFLEEKTKMNDYVTHVHSVVSHAVENYLERGFQNLMVSFGCTGGQHRSVYMADKLATYLSENYDVVIDLQHIEQEKKNWVN